MTISTPIHQLETLVLTLIALLAELYHFVLVDCALFTNILAVSTSGRLCNVRTILVGFLCASLYLIVT
jgi:hypothetical protein